MNKDHNILITGAAGFIGSCMVSFLNQQGYENLFLMDDFSKEEKRKNYERLKFRQLIDRHHLEEFINRKLPLNYVIHLGARTDTTEMNYEIHRELNLVFSQKIWTYCSENQIPLLYASSAATYGNSELGYRDDHNVVNHLQPLNPYGVSKNEFDKWVLNQKSHPPHWYGLKFFNVFGPNEYHKGRMASVIFHAFHQIKSTGKMKLFRSHHPNYIDGGQMRDFIYVKDLLSMLNWLMENQPENGLYNIGTGKAETFLSLAQHVFHSLQLPEQIEFIDTPEDIRDKYQYFTEADMKKLHAAGYHSPCYTFEQAVDDYVKGYLLTGQYY